MARILPDWPPASTANVIRYRIGIKHKQISPLTAIAEVFWQHAIKILEAENLLIIALDNHRSWFRYHDLFCQFLLLHVQTLSPKSLDTVVICLNILCQSYY
jgi:hypothetical protein